MEGNTALQIAARWGNVDFLDALLPFVPDVSPENYLGKTPLHYAVRFQEISSVKKILGKFNFFYSFVLDFILIFCLEFVNTRDPYVSQILYEIIQYHSNEADDVEVFKIIFESLPLDIRQKGDGVNVTPRSLFQCAKIHVNKEVMKYLLEQSGLCTDVEALMHLIGV